MSKQVILLAGLHKTATTSIQNTCFVHRKVLREAGFYYPKIKANGTPDSNHTTLLSELFRASPNRLGLAGQFDAGTNVTASEQELRRAEFAARLAARPEIILLAAEGVSVFTQEEMQNTKRWFAENGFSLRVICHVRRLSGWVRSMVAQRVVGRMALTIGEAVNEFVVAGGLMRPRIEAIERAFPDAEFHSHERAARHPSGPVGFFFDAIGFSMGSRLSPARANEGRSNVASRTTSLINEQFGRAHWAGSSEAFDAHRTGIGLRGMRRLPGAKFTLRSAEIEPIQRMLEQENSWLRARFGEDFHDSHLQFGDTVHGWTPESIAMFHANLEQCPPEVQIWLNKNRDRLELPPHVPQAGGS